MDTSESNVAPSSGQMFPIASSTYYQRWCREQDEIAQLKWIESEKAGHDIGYHRAYWMWATTHRHAWINAMRGSGMPGF